MIHLVTSILPKKCHQLLLRFYAKHACRTILHNKGLMAALAEILFHKYTGKKAHLRRMKKLEQIRKNDVITVAFQVWNLAKWKCDSVYNAMKQHPRFLPIIWVTDDPTSHEQEKVIARKKMLKYFSSPEYHYYYAENKEKLYQKVKPDIIFIQEPYEYNQDAILSVLNDELLCFVCYYISNTVSKSGNALFLNLCSAIRYVENQTVYNDLSIILNENHNLAIAGHPILDYLKDSQHSHKNRKDTIWKAKSGAKKLIWAPHWTITNESFYSNSSFLSICDYMIYIAKKYSNEIHIAFKPHPTLYRTLCNHPKWGKEKTDTYYNLWATMSNTQLEDGEYRDLFWGSDAMIHDCGSFIIEYLVVNKPCLYLQRNKNGYDDFNKFAQDALNCYTIGTNSNDIEKFIIEQVIDKINHKKNSRANFHQQYLTSHKGKTAAENIIESILTIN